MHLHRTREEQQSTARIMNRSALNFAQYVEFFTSPPLRAAVTNSYSHGETNQQGSHNKKQETMERGSKQQAKAKETSSEQLRNIKIHWKETRNEQRQSEWKVSIGTTRRRQLPCSRVRGLNEYKKAPMRIGNMTC